MIMNVFAMAISTGSMWHVGEAFLLFALPILIVGIVRACITGPRYRGTPYQPSPTMQLMMGMMGQSLPDNGRQAS